LWLWVFVSAIAVLFLVGYRSREILDNLLGEAYGCWLMSDGYRNYRAYKNRLRCWAHLLRKAKGLEDSLVQEARGFGTQTTELLETLMEAIYRAREGLGMNLTPQYHGRLNAFRAACERAKDASREKTRALAVEFLNDWEAIFRVFENPHWPLTNSEAYAARGISLVMPRPGLCRVGVVRRSGLRGIPDSWHALSRHNQRFSRNANRGSLGWNRSGATPQEVECARACSFICMSA